MAKKFSLIFLLVALLLTPLSALANSIAETTVEGNPDITTIWVVGDKDIIARAFNATAMVFGDGGMMGLLQLAAVIALMTMLGAVVTKRTIQPFNYFLMIVVMSAAFLPKTSVYVASYYDARGGINGGAVGFKKVDNVPIGVAYPLGIMSSIAKWFAAKYDVSMQALSDTGAITGGSVNVPEGGMMVHGAEGYFSPLKTTLRLRNQFDAPNNKLLLVNLANGSRLCNWSNRWSDADKGGIFEVLARGQQGGMMNFAFPPKTPGGPWEIRSVGCNVAGKVLSLMMLENVTNIPGKNYSPAAVRATGDRNLSNITGEHVPDDQRYAATQKELDQMPNDAARSLGGEQIRPDKAFAAGTGMINDPGAVIAAIRDEVLSGNLQPTSAAQIFTVSNQVNAAELEANMIFSRIVQACVGSGDAACVRNAYMMTEAKNRAAVDTAGEASMFQNFMGHAMNILMFIYIVMCPIIVFVILTMGWSGWKIVTGYLLFAAWINSWLPLDNAIAYYQLQGFTDRMHQLMMTFANSGEPTRVYAPAVINALHDGARDMIATASTMMSAVPLIMLSLLSGSIYGMVQLAQRASMTSKDYIDENKAAPQLDQSDVIGAARMIQNSSAGGPLGSENFAQRILSNADAANPGKIHISANDAVGESLQSAHSAALSLAEKIGTTETTAVISDQGVALNSGYVLMKNTDGSVRLQHVEAGENVQQFMDNGTVGVALGVGGSYKGFIAGGKGNQSFHSTDQVKTAVSDNETRDMSKSDSFAASQGIQTSFGNIDRHQIQQALSQEMADVRSRANQLAQAANSMQQSGYGVDISTGNFAALLPQDASAAMRAGADAARSFSADAGHRLEISSANTASYAQTLQQLSTGSEADKRAALAAIAVATHDSPNGHATALQAANILDAAGKADNLRADIMSSLGSPVSARNAAELGNYDKKLNYEATAAEINKKHSAQQAAQQQVLDAGKQQLDRQFNQAQEAVQTANTERQKAAEQTAAEGAARNTAERMATGYVKPFLEGNQHWQEGNYGQALLSWTSGAVNVIPSPGAGIKPYIKGDGYTGTADGGQHGELFDKEGHAKREAARNVWRNMTVGTDTQPTQAQPEQAGSAATNRNHHHAGIRLMEQGAVPQDNWQKMGGYATGGKSPTHVYVTASAPAVMTRHYVDANGEVTEKQGGSRAWRNNNPGNIEYGSFAKKHGAIGTDGRFAIFPSEESGQSAKAALLFGEKSKFANMSLRQVIFKYAPPNENDSERYYQTVLRSVGSDKIMINYNDQERNIIIKTMARIEGWKEGKEIKK